MVLKRVRELPVGDIAHHGFSNVLLDKHLMEDSQGFVMWWSIGGYFNVSWGFVAHFSIDLPHSTIFATDG